METTNGQLYGSNMIEHLPFICLAIILSIASFTDFRSRKIPNSLTFTSILIAIGYHVFVKGLPGLYFSLLGLAAGIAVLIIPYAMGGMGAGDVKLMGVVGSFLGVKGAFFSFLFTAVFGGVYAVIIIILFKKFFSGFFKQWFQAILNFFLTKKYLPDPIVENKKKPRLCYGIAIALGTFAYMGLHVSGYNFPA